MRVLPRNYPLVARILTDTASVNPSLESTTMRAPESESEAISARVADPPEALVPKDYSSQESIDDENQLLNCPFHFLAQRQIELVCVLNFSPYLATRPVPSAPVPKR